MFTEVIVNDHPYEKRVAILEDNKLVELFVEKKSKANIVGNIYKGFVKDVLVGMGAAFIDIGLERTAFLHYTDLIVDKMDEDIDEERKSKRKDNNPANSARIVDLIQAGQEITVQVQKGPIGKKGARLTCQISIPGKFLVFFPNKDKIAISRKITSAQEKTRIRTILSSVKGPNVGLIVRTEAENCSEEEFIQEYNGLYKTWRFIEKQIKYAKAPVCIFDENNLSNTLIRDIFSSAVDRLVLDNVVLRNDVLAKLKESSPELCQRVELYTEDTPIFDAYGIEKELEKIFQSKIYLPSGGNIVIDCTEALVAIDVNTGSFTGGKNYEDTVKQTNIEAAIEAARQIRLRDLSGIVVLDLIDMNKDSSRADVLDALKKALKRDRAKNKIHPFGVLGLVGVTRKRTRPSLMHTYSEHCPHCGGTGRILSRDSVLLRIQRWLSRAEYFLYGKALEIYVHPNVKEAYGRMQEVFKEIENHLSFIEDNTLREDQFKVFLAEDKKEITAKYNP